MNKRLDFALWWCKLPREERDRIRKNILENKKAEKRATLPQGD